MAVATCRHTPVAHRVFRWFALPHSYLSIELLSLSLFLLSVTLSATERRMFWGVLFYKRMTGCNGNLLRRTTCPNEPGLRCLSGLVLTPVVTTFGIQTKSAANWRKNAGERSTLFLFLGVFLLSSYVILQCLMEFWRAALQLSWGFIT
jgi:hypothetical protein